MICLKNESLGYLDALPVVGGGEGDGVGPLQPVHRGSVISLTWVGKSFGGSESPFYGDPAPHTNNILVGSKKKYVSELLQCIPYAVFRIRIRIDHDGRIQKKNTI